MQQLSLNKQGFVHDYAITGNATQAVKDNFDTISTRNSAHNKGSRLLLNATIKEAIEEVREPIIEQLKEEIQRLVNELKLRDLTKEEYSNVVRAIDVLQKQVQLLSGGKTENIGVEVVTPEREKELIGLLGDKQTKEEINSEEISKLIE